jgi:protein tyrosine phosphatase (PTP) superfamily phosphohydrolase (DUF442 family)
MNRLFLMLLIILSTINISEARSKGIENLQKATTGIYRGARPLNIDEMAELQRIGIKSILNLQGGDMRSSIWKLISWNEPGEKQEMIDAEKSIAETFGIDFMNQPLNSLDPVTNDDNKRINEALEFLHNKKNQPVYIHCEHGKDRTGLVIALYKIKYEGMSAEAAYLEWEKLGHDKKSKIFTGNLDPYFFEKIKEFEK